MGAYSIVIVQPPGYPHSAAFSEVAELLLHGLRRLGHDAVLGAAPSPGRRPIVLGSNLLPGHPIPLPADAILYNLEQIDPGSAWITPALVDLFRRHEVWDYSPRNAARYPALGLPAPRVVPLGWVPELERIAPLAEDVDVLFYGCQNARRLASLDALRARGLRVETLFGVYGAERDRWIARSKLVLNVHFFEAKVFEIVRVSYLLANGRCVVSERGSDPAEEAPFEDAVAFAPYEGLVDRCVELLARPDELRRRGERGREVMSARPVELALRRVLEPGSQGEPGAAAGVSCGRDAPAPRCERV